MTVSGDPADPLEARLLGAFSPQRPDDAYISRVYGEFARLPRPRPRVIHNPWVRLAAAVGAVVSLASVLLLIVKLRPVMSRR